MKQTEQTKIQLPLTFRETRKDFTVVDIRLTNRTIVSSVLLDKDGFAVGLVVGGQLGVDERPLNFGQDDVDSFRRRGWAARFGFAKWHPIRNDTYIA